jgi:thiamine biosynthesis lipoprotein
MVLAACQPAPDIVHLQGRTMGTSYNVKFITDNVNTQSLKTRIDDRLIIINQLMSTYDPESELSRFNQHQSITPFALSPETLYVLQEAKRLGELTGYYLDVTLGPIVRLWGFGADAMPVTIPDEAQITEAKSISGLDKLTLVSHQAVKAIPELYVDLSPIAKGYAVDQIAELLMQSGISDFLVEIGGEMRISGNKYEGEPWRVAVEKPVSQQRAVQKVISIGDNAIATSGDYRNYYERDGKRYSHLIDPDTGKPIQHTLVSATVVHPSSMTADGLATALVVMGLEKAIQLAEQQDIPVLLISKDDDEFKEYLSPAFERNIILFQP